jgi:hypothetical protein
MVDGCFAHANAKALLSMSTKAVFNHGDMPILDTLKETIGNVQPAAFDIASKDWAGVA